MREARRAELFDAVREYAAAVESGARPADRLHLLGAAAIAFNAAEREAPRSDGAR